MKAPRHAHWLVVPALVTGMALGPVAPARAHAPARTPPAKETPEEAEQGEPTTAEPAAEGEPTTAEPTTAEPTTTEPTTTEPTTTEPTTTEPTPEPEPEPAITVQPQPVGPSLETSKLPIGAASKEVVVDPRRLRSDERVLFRAGLLSLGVAAAAVVPMAIGLQQAYVAEQEGLVRYERRMNGLGIGAGIAAGTYAITGVVLLALGSRHRTERRAAVAPAVGPGQVGAMLRARF